VMYDALLCNIQIAEGRSGILQQLGLEPKTYCLVTVHRAENTDDARRLLGIVKAFEKIGPIFPVIWPIHPRTRQALRTHRLSDVSKHSLRIIEPVSYLDMLLLEKEAKVIFTDSGGVQKEAYWLGVPCVTLRDETEWVETLQAGWNTLAGTDPLSIFAAIHQQTSSLPGPQSFYGDGHAAKKIVQALLSSLALCGLSIAK
jgi:UDP-GlcNAc3NAcA epimerase